MGSELRNLLYEEQLIGEGMKPEFARRGACGARRRGGLLVIRLAPEMNARVEVIGGQGE